MPTHVNIRELAIDRGETAASPGRRRRPWLTRYVLPGGLLLGFAAVLAWALRDYFLPAKEVTVIPVTQAKGDAQQAGTRLFTAPGYVEQRPTMLRIAALADGVVDRLLVVENDMVDVGTEVARLIDTDAKLSLAAAQAEYDLRLAEQRQAIAGRVAAQRSFDQPVHLEAPLAEAKAQRTKVETELNSLPFEMDGAKAREQVAVFDYESKTKAKGVLAGVEIEKARAEQEAAKADVAKVSQRQISLPKEVEAMRAREKALEQQLTLKIAETKAVEEMNAQCEAASARVDQAQAALDQAKLRLSRMVVKSPFKGRVHELLAPPGTHVIGEMARSGQHDAAVVATVYQPENLQIRVDVRFEDLQRVSADQPVLLENDALPEPMTGKVLRMTAKTNVQKNTVEVKVVPDKISDALRPEMLLNVNFLAPKQPEGPANAGTETRIFVPAQLVASEDQGSYVWVADQAAGVVRKQKVQTGRKSGEMIEITSGLQVASRLIVAGREGLKDGQRIRVTGEDKQLGLTESSTLPASTENHDGKHPEGPTQ